MERRVLVTEAGSGIGFATALALARIGFEVFGSVPTEADGVELDTRASADGLDVHPLVFDLGHSDTYLSTVQALDLWAVVNNAGHPSAGALEDIPLEEARTHLEVATVAPVRLVLAALPGMRRRGSGRVVNVESVSAGSALPLLGWYRASTRALAELTETLRDELASSGVTVVAVEPGFMDTAVWRLTRTDLHRRFRGSWQRPAYEEAMELVDELRPAMRSPEAAARVVARALTAGRPRRRYSVGPDASSLRAARRLLLRTGIDRTPRQGKGV